MRQIIAVLVVGFGLGLGSPTQAQLPNTDLQMIAPATGKAGARFEVTLSGEHLEEIRGLRFNDARITAAPVTKPEDEFFPEPQAVPNRFTVTIPADVGPGFYEVRSLGYFGLSTARPFMVLPADANEIVETGNIWSREEAMELPLETGVSGKIDSQRIDWFKIAGKKDERLLIEVWAERLDSKLDGKVVVYDAEGRELESNRQHFGRDPLVDFTPSADGEYFVALSDILYRGGSQYFYRLKVSRRPQIDFVFPPAGLRGETSTFTIYGRNLPGGSPGVGASLDGKPLETVQVEIAVPPVPSTPTSFSADTPRRALLPSFEFAYKGSNAVRIGFATAPVVREEPHTAPAQIVTAPCEIAGRFETDGDSDAFRFAGKKDTTYWIETISEQMAVSSDTVLLIRKIGKDDQGAESVTAVAENDDPPTFYSANRQDSTNADTNDAVVSFKADADATYEVKLVNNLASGSIAHRYRLAIREAKPDFQLITTTERNITATNGRAGFPSAPLVRRGGSIAYRVLAPRRDGFEGDIVVTASGLPAGVTAEPLVLSGDTTSGFLTVTAAPDAATWSGPIVISGKATIDGQEVVRTARNASLVWGMIFSDSFRVRSRLDLETVLSVSGKESAPAFITQAEPGRTWEVELNQKLEIPLKVTEASMRKGNLTVQPHGFPGMLRNPPTVAIPEGETEGTLTIDFKPNGNFQATTGRFQFVMQGIGLAKYRYNPGAAARAEAEVKRLETLAARFADEAATANAELVQAQKLLDAAKANAATASESAKADLARNLANAQAKRDAAKQAVAVAEARSKKADQLRTAAAKAAQSLSEKAKEKDTKFATFSPPISVVVKPVAKPQ